MVPNYILNALKGLPMGSSISLLTKEFYHVALRRTLTSVAWVKHATCVQSLKSVDGHMMYSDIDYHSHLSPTYL